MGQVLKSVKLHPAQLAIFDSPARFKVAVAGRRFGKTFLAGVYLGIEALKDRNERGYALGPENGVFYVAPTFDQAKRLMWRRLRIFLGYAKSGGFIVSENINDGYFELVNGRRIYIKGADNEDSLRGEGYSFVVLDEYADMKAHVWDDIIDPALMDVEGGALFIGTPKGKNHFYRLFIGALQKPIDPRTGNNDHWKDWEAFHFVSRDNPFLKEREINRIALNPNKTRESIQQELNATFISGGSKLLKSSNFIIIPYAPRNRGETVITVDLAGFGTGANRADRTLTTDETAIATTSAVEDDWTVHCIEHGRWDPRETALRIVSTVRDNPGARLGIEQGALLNAVGPYLEEYMRTFGRYVTPEPLRHNNQSKVARIEWALRGRMDRGKIALVKETSNIEPWIDWLCDQADDFPDPLAHDDGLDALAYADQMIRANFESSHEIPEWEPLDMDAGY